MNLILSLILFEYLPFSVKILSFILKLLLYTEKNIQKYKPMSILVLRPGLFHRIKANKNKDLFALEIENPYLKNDLIRMQDDYGRKNKGYEAAIAVSEVLNVK